ncbi:MAG TPA: hypothetical protein VFN90_10425, partial [Gemmatimonadales bacterium]|nr:hypothetical protein [Gemmatimonadales bacterium]
GVEDAPDGSGTGSGAPTPPTIAPPETPAPAAPSVPTPAPPAGGLDVIRIDASTMVGRLDTLVSQGGVMIELQTRIARAVEISALQATRGTTTGMGDGAVSEALLDDLELAERTLGTGA